MPNLRIVSNNVADRATLSASTTSGALVAANLQRDDKSTVWRAGATTATLTGTLAVAETAACVHLPFCNLSPSATIRVRLYSGPPGTGLVLDTGVLAACPAPARRPRGWTAAQAASAYANGGGAHARVWFAPTLLLSFTIDLVDAANLQGYIEAARLVMGPYWSPENNASSAPLHALDSTTMYRNGAGGQMADAGTIYRKLAIDLALMPAPDRSEMVAMLLNSRAYPLLISLFPENPDLALERDNMLYGRRAQDSEVSIQYASAYATKLELEEL